MLYMNKVNSPLPREIYKWIEKKEIYVMCI